MVRNQQTIFSENGFGLTSLMASATIAGVLMLAVGGSAGLFKRAMRSVQMKGELEDLRNLIRTQLDCENTMSSEKANCLPGEGGFVTGWNKDNEILIRGLSPPMPINTWPNGLVGTQFGKLKYEVRARCVESSDVYRLVVDYKPKNKDPLTQRELAWQKDLFHDIPWECDLSIANTPPEVSFKIPTDRTFSEPTAVGKVTTVTVTIELTYPTNVIVTVPIDVSGTAVPSEDYDNLLDRDGALIDINNMEIDIAVGDTLSSFTFDVLYDGVSGEPDETVIFEIGNPVNATKILPDKHTVTITEAEPLVGIEIGTTDLAELYIGEDRECYGFQHAGYFKGKHPPPSVRCYYDPIDGKLKQAIGNRASGKCGYVCSTNEIKKTTFGSLDRVTTPHNKTTTVTKFVGTNKVCVGIASKFKRMGRELKYSFSYDKDTGFATGTVWGLIWPGYDKPWVEFSYICNEELQEAEGYEYENVQVYFSPTDNTLDIGTGNTCIPFISYIKLTIYGSGAPCRYDELTGIGTGSASRWQCGYVCGQ